MTHNRERARSALAIAAAGLVAANGCQASRPPVGETSTPRTAAEPILPNESKPEPPMQLSFDTIGPLPAPWRNVDSIASTVAIVDEGTDLRHLQAAVDREGSLHLEYDLDVARYRAQRVIVVAHAKFTPLRWWAVGMVGVDIARSAKPASYDRARSPSIASAWSDRYLVVDIPADATTATLVLAAWAGALSVEYITITPIGPIGMGDQAPRPLAGRSLDNVVAFARLYGAIRYFHPSDQAAALTPAEWERFVRDGVAEAEPALDGAALAAALVKRFAPIAPSAQVYPDTHPLADSPSLIPHDARLVTWKHHGLGLSADSVYRSRRVGVSPNTEHITITQEVPIALVRGAKVRITSRMRATAWGPGADGGLWISSRGASPPAKLYSEPEMQPDLGPTWSRIEVVGVVPANATGFAIGVQVIGDAAVAIDALTVERIDGKRAKPIRLAPWSRGGTLAPDWQPTSRLGTFTVLPAGDGCDERQSCLAIGPVPIPAQPPWIASLGGGVWARVPLTLWHHGDSTQPAATALAPPPSTTPLVATDRATRLAAVVIAWNVFQHFYPYFDVVGADWPVELRTALGRAAIDPDSDAFLATLRRMIGALRDGHGFVDHPRRTDSVIVPWTWRTIEGALVINRVAADCACDLAPGDVVVAIDGVATAEAMAAIAPEHTMATQQATDVEIRRFLRTGVSGDHRRLRLRRGVREHEVNVALVNGAVLGHQLDELRPKNGVELTPGIRYVDIGNCTVEEWASILPQLAAARAVVVDLRGYPSTWSANLLGHFIDHTISSAQWHIPSPSRPDREHLTFEHSDWQVFPLLPRIHRPVFLTDARAVSAAETVMGMVEHYRLGEIVGAVTAGTNGNMNPFELPGGYQVMWTGMKVLKHDGSQHHGVGIRPTVSAEPTIAGVTAGRDEVLERAIAIANQSLGSPARRSHARPSTRHP